MYKLVENPNSPCSLKGILMVSGSVASLKSLADSLWYALWDLCKKMDETQWHLLLP